MRHFYWLWSLPALLVLFCFQPTASYAQVLEPGSATDLKEEARAAYLGLIQTYPNRDCEAFSNHFGEAVIFINSSEDIILETSEAIELDKYCAKTFKQANTRMDPETYQQHYQVLVYSFEEFSRFGQRGRGPNVQGLSAESRSTLQALKSKSHRFDQNDLLVIGYEPQPGDGNELVSSGKGKKSLHQIDNKQQYLYVLRKTNHGWKIKGLLQ